MAACANFREVLINLESTIRWREINIKSGADCSVIGEAVCGDTAGGYSYQESSHLNSAASNRFIYWRASKDVLELVETSLDLNLSHNGLRLRFQNSPVLSGVSVQEAGGHVFVLVPTVFSVHRLVFPHPNRLQQYDHGFLQRTEHSVLSIFSDSTVNRFNDPGNSHCFNPTGHLSSVITSCASWIGSDGEAIFTVAISDGRVLLIKMPRPGCQEAVFQQEMKSSSVMQRLWTGLVPSVLRGDAENLEAAVNTVIHPVGDSTLSFSVCKDHKLRVWSCKTLNCVLVTDLLQYVPNPEEQSSGAGSAKHLVRKSVTGTGHDLVLAVYLLFSRHSQMIILQPFEADGNYRVHHVATLFPTESSLVDYCLTNTSLWSLWKTADGESIVKVANIDRTQKRSDPWLQVIMEAGPSAELQVPSHLDPRQFYTEEIFYPGKFSTYTVLKALNIYKRSLDSTELNDTNIPTQALKAEVTTVIGVEIQKAVGEYEVDQEEYIRLETQQWSKFYSCCVQYQERYMKALGFFIDSNTGLVGTVKKRGCSVLRPAQVLEHLYMCPSEDCCVEDLQTVLVLRDDEPLCGDVLSLCDCLKAVRSCLTDDIMYYFEQDMFHIQSPVQVGSSIVTNLLNDSNGEQRDVSTRLREISLQVQSINELVQSIECLLMLLDLNETQDEADMADDDVQQMEATRLFSSAEGVDVLCTGVCQMLATRFEMSRDLLLFLLICLEMKHQAGVDFSVAERIAGDFVSKASLLVQVYYVMKWSASIVTQHPQASAIESNAKQLEVLELIDTAGYNPMQKYVGQSLTVLELFLKSEMRRELYEKVMSQGVVDEDPCMFWRHCLMPVSTIIAQFLWPLNGRATFIELMLRHSQFSHIQEYVRLTRIWCEWNISTSVFMLAYSYMNCCEPDKANDCFLEASHGVSSEEFLMTLIHGQRHDPASYNILYYLKVISLFEVLQLPKHIVGLAKAAITEADSEDPYLATLWSKIFKQELEMGHNEEAYNAMLSNPDSSRRKDCLRQFLVVLCDKSDLQTLIELPYRDRQVDLEEEVVHILESRARSIDLVKQNYYDLLYSFHVFRGNYRKAGAVMYEYGMRLEQEVSGLKGLQKQAKCYLAALNALRQVNPDYAWIVKPVPSLNQDEDREKATVKHTLSGQELHIPTKKQVEIVELESIEKEYMLLHARLEILQTQPDPAHMAGPTASADEMIGLLSSAGLFDTAIKVGRVFRISLKPLFESLASRCVSLSQNSSGFGENEYTAQAWTWLSHNNLTASSTPKQSSSVEEAWKLLKRYLESCEEPQTTQYHRAIATRLLSHDFTLPNWFKASYKRLNTAELLRLYLSFDFLDEAGHLAIEYIDAVMGKGKEYFGLKTFLHPGSPGIWLPYTTLDQLLMALRDVTDIYLAKLYQELEDRLNALFQIVEEVAQDNLEMGYRKNTTFHGGQQVYTNTTLHALPGNSFTGTSSMVM